ncbi:tyrosine-type recombinase/integrase [Streptomyces collinus]|uniref:tyrosine-type recombinase/integrase n=1 Tax=Streptomyces collinus TaxID=42684 RepID=UPI00365C09B1
MVRRSVDRPGRGRGSRGRAACTRPGRAGKRTRSFHGPCGKGRAAAGSGSTDFRHAARALQQGWDGDGWPYLLLADAAEFDLRHTCASLLHEQDADARMIMEVLGHSSIRVTMDIYTFVRLDSQRHAFDRVGNALRDTGS